MLLIAASLLTFPTVVDLATIWNPSAESVLSHGWLVVAVALYGLLFGAGSIADVSRRPMEWWFGAITVAVVGFGWAWARSSGIAVAEHVLWFCLILSSVGMLIGLAALSTLFRPFVVLFTALPVWDLFHPFLWRSATVAVQTILTIIGLPAYFEGNRIHLAAGTLEIAAGCAGLAFFSTAISIAAMIAWLNKARWREYLLLFAAAAAMAMVCNWVRIAVIAAEAQRTSMQTTLITNGHYTFGWIVFAIGLLGYVYFFASRSKEPVAKVNTAAGASGIKIRASRVFPAMACLALGPAILWAGGYRLKSADAIRPVQMPERSASWRQVDPQHQDWSPRFWAADYQAMFVSEGGHESVYANLYRYQRQGHELIGGDNSLLAGRSWTVRTSTILPARVSQELEGPQSVFWSLSYIYVCGMHRFTSAIGFQLGCGLEQLFRPVKSGVVAVLVRCQANCEPDLQRIAAVWDNEVKSVAAQIGGKR
jgi:exosortase